MTFEEFRAMRINNEVFSNWKIVCFCCHRSFAEMYHVSLYFCPEYESSRFIRNFYDHMQYHHSGEDHIIFGHCYRFRSNAMVINLHKINCFTQTWSPESSAMYCRVLNLMSTDVQLRTRQYIAEDFELHTHCRENLKSHVFYTNMFYVSILFVCSIKTANLLSLSKQSVKTSFDREQCCYLTPHKMYPNRSFKFEEINHIKF
jgi:hypothetical protein